jgi:methylglyoxal synthase
VPNRMMEPTKRVALVAHDGKKQDLLEWAKFNRKRLQQHELYATGTTGTLLERKLGFEIHKLKSGPMGGDQQIGAMVADGALDLIIFMTDGLESHAHSPDISALVRLASVYNIPIACNRSSADFIISSPLFGGAYEIQMTDYSAYINRMDNVD